MSFSFLMLFYFCNWIQSTGTFPEPRHLEEIVFDSHRKQLILFGGVQFPPGGKIATPETVFEWSGKNWKEIKSSGPGNRLAPGLVYDSEEKITYLFGGVDLANGKETVKLDVWMWDGTKWELNNSTCPVKSGKPVYDTFKKRVLMYGDAHNLAENWKGGDPRKFELWEFKNNVWTRLSSTGPVLNSPYDLVYDQRQQSLVIPAWENGKSVVWRWTNEQWQKSEAGVGAPSERNRYTLAYHEKEEATYLFGGRNDGDEFLDDFWKWDGVKWTKVETPKMPGGKAACNMEYGNNELLLYGGTMSTGVSNELWRWKNGVWELVGR